MNKMIFLIVVSILAGCAATGDRVTTAQRAPSSSYAYDKYHAPSVQTYGEFKGVMKQIVQILSLGRDTISSCRGVVVAHNKVLTTKWCVTSKELEFLNKVLVWKEGSDGSLGYSFIGDLPEQTGLPILSIAHPSETPECAKNKMKHPYKGSYPDSDLAKWAKWIAACDSAADLSVLTLADNTFSPDQIVPISTKLSAKDEIWVVSSARRIEDESPTGVPLLREMNVVYGPKLYGAEPKILKCKDSKRNRALYACWPESGDVGGPVFKKIGTKWELVGIQSWMTLDPWNQSQESLGRAYSDFHEIVNWHWYLDKTYHHKYRDAFSKDFPFAFSVGWMTPEIEALVK